MSQQLQPGHRDDDGDTEGDGGEGNKTLTAQYRRFLHEGHAKYQREQEEQYHLIESGSFVRQLAASLSRMPVFHTTVIHHPQRRIEKMSGPSKDEMLEYLASSFSWAEVEQGVHGLSQGELTPMRVLSELPIAMHLAGKSLRHLVVKEIPFLRVNIELLPPRGSDPTSPAWHELRAALGNLESVSI
ncbi:hypothetical protein IMZ48_42015, partial [Candidatus Bathyarchaeota archaeon]|nr:hypothetical protein [Candidatus Bathyarchaeota archaeon]